MKLVIEIGPFRRGFPSFRILGIRRLLLGLFNKRIRKLTSVNLFKMLKERLIDIQNVRR